MTNGYKSTEFKNSSLVLWVYMAVISIGMVLIISCSIAENIDRDRAAREQRFVLEEGSGKVEIWKDTKTGEEYLITRWGEGVSLLKKDED